MATFTESQITDIAAVLSTNSEILADHLSHYATIITESDKTKVLADVTAYEAIADDNVRVHPRERNFGAEINPGEKRNLILKRIASLLYWDVPMAGVSRLMRA